MLNEPSTSIKQRIGLLLVMSACFACVALDNSKLVAALPTLARQTSASPEALRWVVEASLLVYASLLLLGGSLSERFGARRMLLWGLAVFGGASIAGSLSTSLFGLIAARAALGAGAACMTPATLATIKHSFPEQERARAIAVWTASFGVGAALGPVLAGLLLSRGGISAVLLSNLPLVLACAWGTQRTVSPGLPRRAVPLDWLGALLCLLSAGTLLFALLSGPTRGWLVPEVSLAALAAALLGVAAFAWFRQARHPLLDLGLFTEARFARALLVIFLGYFAFSGVSFVIAQYLQLARERSAFSASLLNLPLPSSLLLGTLLAPRCLSFWGAQRALLYSLGLALLGALALAYASERQNEVLLCLALVPFGGGSGSTFAMATELTLGSVAQERAATAGAVSESAFELGGALGVAVLSTLLAGATLSRQGVAHSAPRALWVGALALLLALGVASRVTGSAYSDP